MAHMEEDEKVAAAFRAAGIIPDCIQSPPKALLTISYGDGSDVELGTEMKPSQVVNEPKVHWEGAEAGKYYLLCMTDLDAPGRRVPLLREINHWMIGNIPGNDIDKGELLMSYRGSGPPPGLGLHRYVFLLYQQPGKLTFNEIRVPKGEMQATQRMRFKMASFATKYQLGDPIAGNFFEAQSERSCTIS